GSSINSATGIKNAAQALFPTTLGFPAQGTFYNLGNHFHFGENRTQYQLSEDFVKTSGNHKVGFGGSLVRVHWTWKGYPFFGAGGRLDPQTLDAFYQGGVDSASPDSDYTVFSQSFASNSSERFAFYQLGLYGQDEWHAQPNLTLTL